MCTHTRYSKINDMCRNVHGPLLPAQGQPLRGLGQPLRGFMGGGMDRRRDRRTDGRTYGRTDSPYSTGLCLLRFPPEPLPCSHNSYQYKISDKGKGTDDHLLPLGDWFSFI